MISWLLLAAVSAAPVQVESLVLTVAKNGHWVAEGDVRINAKGNAYFADRAEYRPANGIVYLSGNVRSAGKGLELECERLQIGRGHVTAKSARALLRADDGKLLAELRAVSLVRRAGDAVFDEVEFSLCTCPDRPWSVGARRVEIAGEAERVSFSLPVFRIREVPVLALPWWSMPLKRRASGVLPPVMYYDARDGLRARLPVFWAPSRWWDLSIEPGLIQDRGPWSLTELRMRPNSSTALYANLETLHGRGMVDDQGILGLHYTMIRPGINWVHRGLFPSDGRVVSLLSTDTRARAWRIFDAHHHLRLGAESIGLLFQGWSGRQTPSSEGPEKASSVALRTVSQARFRYGSAHLDLGMPPMPLVGATQATPMIDGLVHAGNRWAPYLGISAALGLRSVLFASSDGGDAVSRGAARFEAYTVLDNGRGTRLRPRLSLRAQRVTAVSARAPVGLLGVSGEVVSLGLQARQPGFVHDYELLGFHRNDSEGDLNGLLLAWTGVWQRRRWSLYGRLLMDSLDQAPAMFTTTFGYKPKTPGRDLRVSYLRRHVGRDLTIDPDPWLFVNQQSYADRLEADGIYSLIWGTAQWRNQRWHLAATSALRPIAWSLNSIRLEGGYNSACKCWGLVAYGGYSGEISPGQVTATPFFGLSFNSGQTDASFRQQVSGALGRMNPSAP